MQIRERVVVYVTRPGTDGPDVLVFHGPTTHGMQAPAGGVEPGETPQQAALREVFEEAGVRVDNVRRLHAVVWRYSFVDAWCVQHFFHAEAPVGLPDTWPHTVECIGDEHGREVTCEWVPARRLDRLVGGQGNAAAFLLAAPPPTASPDVRIRLATAADVPAVNALRNHYIRTSTAIYTEEPVADADYLKLFASRDLARHPLTVAEIDGRFVGFGMLSKHDDKCGYAATVENSVYVASDLHRRGVGTALLADLIARAESIGHRCILARIDTNQHASLALHLRHGFAPVGVLRCVGEKFGRVLDVALLQYLVGAE